MKIFLLAFLSLYLAVGIGLVAQERSNPAPPQEHQAAGTRLTSIMGTVSERGEKLTLLTDQRAWNVDNPGTLRGHEGHYVRVDAYVYADTGSIHISEVKMPTASETTKHDRR